MLDSETIRLAELTESGSYYKIYPLEFITAYGAEGATNQDVIDSINNGVRVVNYFGHGLDEYGWAVWNTDFEDFDKTCVDELDNGSMTPVVFSIACLTAAPFSDFGCGFGVYAMRQDDGPVAYFGATVPSNTITDIISQRSFVSLFDQGIPTITEATNEATVHMLVAYSLSEEYADDFIWYGDPTLSIIPEAEGPDAPDLLSPLWGESFSSPSSVTLDWSDVGRINGAMISAYYHFQLSREPDFSTPIYDQFYAYSEYTIPGLGEDVYYWRVRARFSGEFGPWSETSHFFIGAPTAATVLLEPIDNEKIENLTNTITFHWHNDLNPDLFTLQIDDDIDFSSPLVVEKTADSEFTFCSSDLPDGTYYWRVCGMTIAAWPWSETWSYTFTELNNQGQNGNNGIEAYPNPFNPSTVIRFELPRAGKVRLDIYNVKGQLVTTLEDGYREAGVHEIPWNGKNSKGISVGSGMYFYRLEAGSMVTTKKMLLIK